MAGSTCLTVNGAVQTIEARAQAHDPFPLRQRKLLFRNLGNGRFEDVTERGGAAFSYGVGRGAAFGDMDNDGDTDVVVANNSGTVRLLINTVGNKITGWACGWLVRPLADGTR